MTAVARSVLYGAPSMSFMEHSRLMALFVVVGAPTLSRPLYSFAKYRQNSFGAGGQCHRRVKANHKSLSAGKR